MPTFKACSKEWLVTIDAPKIKAVRKECGVDLGALDGTAFSKLDSDPCLLVDVLWAVCRGQANGVSPEQFGEGLVGDAIGDATTALVNAVTDFFPQQKKSLLQALSQKQATVQEKGLALAMAKISDPEMEKNLIAAMDNKMTRELNDLLTSLNGATNSQGSAESGPKD